VLLLLLESSCYSCKCSCPAQLTGVTAFFWQQQWQQQQQQLQQLLTQVGMLCNLQ
jgi:hypothetical protein